MSNETKWDLLAALAALKKKDRKAFNALLLKLNVEKWSEIKEEQFPEAMATCRAKLGDAEASDGEMVEEIGDAAKVDAMGRERNAKLRPTAKADDLRTLINGAPDLATGLERAAFALYTREANRANAATK